MQAPWLLFQSLSSGEPCLVDSVGHVLLVSSIKGGGVCRGLVPARTLNSFSGPEGRDGNKDTTHMALSGVIPS